MQVKQLTSIIFIQLGRHLRCYVINFRKLIIDTDTKSLFLLRMADIYIYGFFDWGGVQQMYISLHIQNTEVLFKSSLLPLSAMLYLIFVFLGNWIDLNFKSSLDVAVYIYKLQCKPK